MFQCVLVGTKPLYQVDKLKGSYVKLQLPICLRNVLITHKFTQLPLGDGCVLVSDILAKQNY